MPSSPDRLNDQPERLWTANPAKYYELGLITAGEATEDSEHDLSRGVPPILEDESVAPATVEQHQETLFQLEPDSDS